MMGTTMDINNFVSIPGIFALIVAIAALLNSQWNVRKDYQYLRSSNVTKARFDREFKEIDRVSQTLGLLIMRTKDVMRNGNKEDVCRLWETAHTSARKITAESALFLKYFDLESSAKEDGIESREFCGVCKAANNDDGVSVCDYGKSLYSLAEEIIEECENGFVEGSNCSLVGSFLRDENTIISRDDEKSAENSANKDGALSKTENLYNRFLLCANCRLKAVETGKRDAQRIERRKHLGIQEFSPEYKTYERTCPRDRTDNDGNLSRLNESWRPMLLAVILACVLGFGVPACIYSFFNSDLMPQCLKGNDQRQAQLYSIIAIVSYVAIYRALFVSKITSSTIEKVIVWTAAITAALCSTAAIVLYQIPANIVEGLQEMAFPLAMAGAIIAVAVIFSSRPILSIKSLAHSIRERMKRLKSNESRQ